MDRNSGVNVLGYSISSSETSRTALILVACHSSPVMESPDLEDIAEGVNLGPKSSACALVGDVTLTERTSRMNQQKLPVQVNREVLHSNQIIP